MGIPTGSLTVVDGGARRQTRCLGAGAGAGFGEQLSTAAESAEGLQPYSSDAERREEGILRVVDGCKK